MYVGGFFEVKVLGFSRLFGFVWLGRSLGVNWGEEVVERDA